MPLEDFDWEVGDITVLHLMGPITFGQGTSKLRGLIQNTVDAGKKKILINMKDVNYLDSAGLGELVAAHTTVARQGGKLKLVKLTRRVQDLVQLTRVHRIFEVFDDEEAAIRSFEQVL